MAMSTKYCKRDSTTDLYTNEQGDILTKEDIIFRKKHQFIIMDEGYIDHYTSGAMDNIFQAPDSEFKTLQEKVKNQKSERRRSFIARLLRSLTGNNKTIKRQVALQRPLKESSEGMALCCDNSLDGSYINRNIVNKAKGPAPAAESDTQNGRQLVAKDFNEKCDEYFTELFHNVDIDNQEITEPLIAEYYSKVRNLLVGIQTAYSFRLHCHDMEYDDVVVWTDLLKILVRRNSIPLAQQTNHNVNPRPNFHSHPPQ